MDPEEKPEVFVRHCQRRDTNCREPALWIPVLLLYPSVMHGPSKPMTLQVWEPVCTMHKDDARVKDYATDKIYRTAEKACANAGVPWPEPSLTRLKFIPYAQSSLARIKDAERSAEN